jgi:acetyl esterase/lipase
MYARLYAGEAPLGAVSPRRHLDAASIGDASSSSLEAAAAAAFPPLQIEVGGREVFRDAIESFAQGARSAGCAEVRLNVGSDHAHVYQLFASRSASAIDSMRRMGRFIVEQTSSAGSSAPQYGSAVPVAQKSHDE